MNKFKSLTILAVAGGLFANAAYAGSCDATIANLVSWLNQGPLYNVTATIASNRPPQSIPQPNATASQVTYSKVDLQKTGGWFTGGLYAPAAGKLYYDDRFYASSNPSDLPGILYPFDPSNTSTLGVIITAAGTVYVYPGNTSQSFAATCSGGVMFGQPAAGGGIVAQFPPMYTITFRLTVSSPPI